MPSDAFDPSSLRARLGAALAVFPDVRLGLLFGSHARGTAGPASDVDVAITAASGADLLAIAAALSAACGREVDVVPLDDPGVPLLQELIRDAQTIYEACPGAAADWRSKTLWTLETDGPWYARMRDAWLARVAREGL